MRFAAALVHIFTALGAVCALMASLAITEKSWESVFFWLGIAFLIDGIDGTFARMVDVTERLPRFSGERLDLVIDYVTYVFVPVLAMLSGGYLQGHIGIILGAIILLSSLFHFSDTESKADDYSFVGFPAIWNIVAFYVFVFGVPPIAAAALVSACAALTFARLKWVHPLRVRSLRPITVVLTVIWSIAAVVSVVNGFAETGWLVKGALLVVAAYGIGLAMLNPVLRQT